MSRAQRYILFTKAEHESIKFDFTMNQIEKFIAMWKAGATYTEICDELKINQTTLALLVMDLSFVDAIKNRPNGIFGGSAI